MWIISLKARGMDSKFVIVTIEVWLLFMVLAIINAGIRNEVYKPVVGDLAAHQISSIIFIAVILVVTYAILRFSNLELSDFEAFFYGHYMANLNNHV